MKISKFFKGKQYQAISFIIHKPEFIKKNRMNMNNRIYKTRTERYDISFKIDTILKEITL